MNKREYEAKCKRLYNLRRARIITYTEYEKRMAELKKAYEEKGNIMKRVETWKDNGAGYWAFFFEDGVLVYAHDYAAHEADLQNDVKEFFENGADGWDGNALDLDEFPTIYDEVTGDAQSISLTSISVYNEIR